MNKKLYFFNAITTIFLTISLFASCSNSTGGIGEDSITIDTSKATTDIYTGVTNARNICSNTYEVILKENNGNRSVSEENYTQKAFVIDTVSYFQGKTTKPFIFFDRNGKQFVFTKEKRKDDWDPIVIKLSNNTIAFRYDSVYEIEKSELSKSGYLITNCKREWNKKALVDLRTGNFYDFSDYSFNRIKSNDKYIFAYGNEWNDQNKYDKFTLYKIDINTLRAEPLNNGQYDSMTQDGYSSPFTLFDNEKIILNKSFSPTVLFIEENRAPCTISTTNPFNQLEVIGTYPFLGTLEANKYYYTPYIFRADDGQLYFFAKGIINPSNRWNKQSCYLTGKIKLNIPESNNGNATFTLYDTEEKIFPDYIRSTDQEYTVYRKDGVRSETSSLDYSINHGNKFILVPYRLDSDTYGHIIELEVINGKPNVKFYKTSKNVLDYYPKEFLNEKFYFVDYDKINSYDYKTNTTQNIYTLNGLSLLPEISCLNDSILFKEYIDKTTVATFKIPITGGEKELLTTEATAIRDIINMDL